MSSVLGNNIENSQLLVTAAPCGRACLCQDCAIGHVLTADIHRGASGKEKERRGKLVHELIGVKKEIDNYRLSVQAKASSLAENIQFSEKCACVTDATRTGMNFLLGEAKNELHAIQLQETFICA